MNDTPIFRNPDKYQVLSWREWMRAYLPPPGKGMVIEDLDLVPLRFSKLCDRPYSADGKFSLVEIKQNGAEMGYAQKRVFSLMHKLLRKADPEREFYNGFFLIEWNCDKCFDVRVNGYQLDELQFRDFMLGRKHIDSMFDKKGKSK